MKATVSPARKTCRPHSDVGNSGPVWKMTSGSNTHGSTPGAARSVERLGAHSPEPRQRLQQVPDERGGLVGNKVGATPGAGRASHRAQGEGGSEVGTSRPWETPTSPRKFGGSQRRPEPLGERTPGVLAAGATVRRTELETKVTPRKPQRTTWEVQSFPSTGLCRGVPCPGAVPSPPAWSRRWRTGKE